MNNNFITVGDTILRIDTIKRVKISYNSEYTDDYKYMDNGGYRPTNIHLDILTTDENLHVIIKDDDFLDYVKFVSALYGSEETFDYKLATTLLYNGINLDA